jgi:hypothetical protein
MTKDFQYIAQFEANPYEAVSNDMKLLGAEHVYSLDEMEFMLRYGITKDHFKRDFGFQDYAPLKATSDNFKPLTKGGMDEMMKTFRTEATSHLSTLPITKKKEKVPVKDLGTRPSQVAAKSAPKPANNVAVKTEMPKPPKPPAPKLIQAANDAFKESPAEKEFMAYKQQLLRATKGSFPRTAINLREKALRKQLAAQDIRWGTPEWSALVKEFFPGANFGSSIGQTDVAETAGNDILDQLPAENITETTIGNNDTTENTPDKVGEVKADITTKEPAVGPVAEPPKEIASANNEVKTQNAEAKDAEKTDKADNAEATKEDTATEATNVIAKAPVDPKADPEFLAVVTTTEQVATTEKAHQTPAEKTAEASVAADPKGTDVTMMAQKKQVDVIEAAPVKEFDPKAFKAMLMERIVALTPKNLDEADKFAKSDKIDSVKKEASSKVKDEKKAASNTVEQKTKEAPKKDGIAAKEVKPLPPVKAGAKPTIESGGAAVKPKTKEEVSAPLEENTKAMDKKMASAEITDEQLANSNEPAFQGALDAKKAAKEDAVNAPGKFRQEEQGIIAQSKIQANTATTTGVDAMHGVRSLQFQKAHGNQETAKTGDEAERTKVSANINAIYEKTKTSVESVLNNLDTKVDKMFDEGAETARKAFEGYVNQCMDEYKDKRYSGLDGAARWIHDLFMGLPDEVNVFYVKGREVYINLMDKTLDGISKYVSSELKRAKQLVADGKKEIKTYVSGLPEKLKKFGQETAGKILEKFVELEQSIVDKQGQIVDNLAGKYSENLKAVDSRIEEMKAANTGLVSKFTGAIAGVIATIIQIKNMLLDLLKEAQDAIMIIISDPIKFLGNLITALKNGFLNFVSNIGTHLKNGLMTWLFGEMGNAGITMPEKFDLSGIFSLVLQVLGLTWANIRSRALKFFPEKVVSALETSFEIFLIIKNKGLAGLWEYVQEKIGDLKTMVIDAVKDMVITQIIQAGVQWLVGLLGGPAGLFVKAAKAIIDIVKWFMDNAARIFELIAAIVHSISDIAHGKLDQASKWVENALAKTIPIIIGFLASLLGLGNLSAKVKAIIQKIQAPVNKAIDWVFSKAKAFAGKLMAGGKKLIGKGKDAINKMKEWWKLKKSFKTKKGEEHKVFFTGKDSNAELMVASDEMSVKDFLKTKEVKELKEKDTEKHIESALALVKKIGKDKEALAKINMSKDGVKTSDDVSLDEDTQDLVGHLKWIFENKEGGNDEINAAALDTDKITPDEKIKVEENENKTRGEQIVGYKGKTKGDKSVMSVGAPGGNKYTKRIDEKGTHKEQFEKLVPLTTDQRRKIINENVTHDKFKPINIEEKIIGGGKKEITYVYADGKQQFKVIIGADGYPESVQGDNLTLHNLGRGVTEDPKGKKTGSGHDAAHLIANMFGGSGYKKAENLVATSAWYNQKRMKDEEDAIKKWINGNPNAHHFSMKVDITYLKSDEKVTIEEIIEAILQHIDKDDERRELVKDKKALQEQIDAKLKESGQDRVKSVIYSVGLFTKDNKPIVGKQFKILESDLLFGTKK